MLLIAILFLLIQLFFFGFSAEPNITTFEYLEALMKGNKPLFISTVQTEKPNNNNVDLISISRLKALESCRYKPLDFECIKHTFRTCVKHWMSQKGVTRYTYSSWHHTCCIMDFNCDAICIVRANYHEQTDMFLTSSIEQIFIEIFPGFAELGTYLEQTMQNLYQDKKLKIVLKQKPTRHIKVPIFTYSIGLEKDQA